MSELPTGTGKTYVITDRSRFTGGEVESDDFQNHLNSQLLVVCLIKDVFLPVGGDELQAVVRGAGRPLVPLEAVRHVAGAEVLLVHHRDDLHEAVD